MLDKTIEQIFESKAKIRTLRLFLMNPEGAFSVDEASKSAELPKRSFRKELAKLMKIGLVDARIDRILIEKPRKSKRNSKKALKPKIKILRKRVFFVNKNFDLYPELRNLVFKTAPNGRGELLSKVRHLGDIKLALISGIFTNTAVARADMVLVGDKLKKTRISKFLKNLRSEFGKDLNYSVMTTNEFNYRFGMQDRFIRDILEYPHEKLINKLGL